jgi:hypothetical protein
MTLFKYFFKKTAIELALKKDDLEFQYVDGGLSPDIIHVFSKKIHLLSYHWVDGERAVRYSNLEALHARYQLQHENNRWN